MNIKKLQDYTSVKCVYVLFFALWVISCNTSSKEKEGENFTSQSQNGVMLQEFIKCIEGDKIEVKSIKGKFDFYDSDYENNIFKSVFPSENFSINMQYHHYGAENFADTLIIGRQKFKINKDKKLDSQSIKIHEFLFNGRNYLCMVGKAISASGSGTQLSYYVVFEHIDYKIVSEYFLESRFGDVVNIGDFDKDGKLDYLSLSRNEDDKILVRIVNLDKEINKTNSTLKAKLEYLGNGKFLILESKFNSNC